MTITVNVSQSDLEEAVGMPMAEWSHKCHQVSLAIVKSGVLGTYARVARGFCKGVSSQHSWIVCDRDVWKPGAVIVDPTLWSYDDVEGIMVGAVAKGGRWRAHGTGSIWAYGQPVSMGGPTVALSLDAIDKHFDDSAHAFHAILEMPFDRRAWQVLANAPVGDHDWPARQFIEAMLDTPELAQLVPIDIEGMLTDRNPDGLYLA